MSNWMHRLMKRSVSFACASMYSPFSLIHSVLIGILPLRLMLRSMYFSAKYLIIAGNSGRSHSMSCSGVFDSFSPFSWRTLKRNIIMRSIAAVSECENEGELFDAMPIWAVWKKSCGSWCSVRAVMMSPPVSRLKIVSLSFPRSGVSDM